MVRVFKFGGASVKDAAGVQNLAAILGGYSEKLIVVVSAMGKTTNALEELTEAYFEQTSEVDQILGRVKEFHFEIARQLFSDPFHPVFQELAHLFELLYGELSKPISMNYDFDYDRLVSFGELFSTTIVAHFLRQQGQSIRWMDIRHFLKTDTTYREGQVDWELSKKLVKSGFTFDKEQVYVTQGFIGSTTHNLTTTLGREGSDFTAAALAYLLEARDVTVWKDVPGLLNADPKWMEDAIQLEKISYQEAIEQTFYGAKVIHPKTIRPLKNSSIPLYVRSFMDPTAEGTIIGQFDHLELPPIFIRKQDQVLLTIKPKDFSFIGEENIRDMFFMFAEHRLKVSLMENTAVSFSVCADFNARHFPLLIKALGKEFKVRYNRDVELITVRHYTKEAIRKVVKDKDKILLEQKSRNSARFVMVKK